MILWSFNKNHINNGNELFLYIFYLNFVFNSIEMDAEIPIYYTALRLTSNVD